VICDIGDYWMPAFARHDNDDDAPFEF